jgi:3-(3-hydroxy-phenyl)propionate hydroxylase
MHQPNLQPNPSSYFEYRIYPFARPPEMDGANPRHQVVIVGAGPIGLVLAIQLAMNGVKTVIIESEAQVSGGSRAVALTNRTMEIIDQCDAAQAFLDQGGTWTEGRSYYRGIQVHHLIVPFSADNRFAPMTNLPQCMMEDVLIERALALGVEIRFQTLLTAMQEHEWGCALTLDTPQGEYALQAQWLIGCDGARSTVRRLQGLRFEGESFESRFVIADISLNLDAPLGRRCYFDPPWLPGHSVLFHKVLEGLWRVDYQVPDDVSDEQALNLDRISAQVQAHLKYVGADLPWALEWVTLYKPNALTLAKYNHGRVLYCGDAAHLLPVFGVRGMNTGAQDALNLAWKLAAVVKGQSDRNILDTYSTERVADARQICLHAGRSTRVMAPPSRGFEVLRQAVLSLSLDNAFTRQLLDWRTSHPIPYADSPLNWPDEPGQAWDKAVGLGAPAKNVRLQGADGHTAYLLDWFAPEAFHVLVFGDDEKVAAHAAAQVAAARAEGMTVRMIALPVAAQFKPAGADAVLVDPQRHAQQVWGAASGSVFLLRPDHHVAARWHDGAAARIHAALERALCLAER